MSSLSTIATSPPVMLRKIFVYVLRQFYYFIACYRRCGICWDWKRIFNHVSQWRHFLVSVVHTTVGYLRKSPKTLSFATENCTTRDVEWVWDGAKGIPLAGPFRILRHIIKPEFGETGLRSWGSMRSKNSSKLNGDAYAIHMPFYHHIRPKHIM